jgi:predicted O-methyltransferase YrrM
MAHLYRKTWYLLRSGQGIPLRVRNKIDGWMGRFSAPSMLEGVRSEGDLQEALSEFGVGTGCLADPGLLSLERHLCVQQKRLAVASPPFEVSHNATIALGRLCYAVCRELRPAVVVETGVAYGVTSAYVLQALAENGEGELHSIDLPPLGRDARKYVGYLVPEELRTRWKLRLGSARVLLPQVLREARGVDVFIHDSLHTYSHMKTEFAAVLAALRHGGVLISDDVQCNRAFEETLGDSRITSWFAVRVRDNGSVCGAMRRR